MSCMTPPGPSISLSQNFKYYGKLNFSIERNARLCDGEECQLYLATKTTFFSET